MKNFYEQPCNCFLKAMSYVAPKFIHNLLTKPIPNESSMPYEFNKIYKWILSPFLNKSTLDLADQNILGENTKDASIVYISQRTGQLEYGFLSKTLPEAGLPRAKIASGTRYKRWFPFKIMIPMLAQSIENKCEETNLKKLTSAIKEGVPSFISIRPSLISDPLLFTWKQNQALTALVEASKSTSKPVYIIPITFIWDRRPKPSDSKWKQNLFSNADQPGILSRCFLFVQRYFQRAVVRVGKPISLSSFINDESKQLEIENIRNELLKYFEIQKRSITGPPIRPKKWFIDQILDDENVRKTCAKISKNKLTRADDVLQLAKNFAKKMVADIKPHWFDLAHPIVKRGIESSFSEINVVPEELERLRKISSEHATVIVPNHLSHADYVILSYILYKNNLPIPHVTSGDNLSFWPLGPVLRRMGAYFIPRSLKGNDLYKELLSAYLKLLIREDYLQEFYIEGGRSRTGRLNSPRYGIIKLLANASSDANKPVYFIPTSISYEQVAEQKDLTKEVKGEEKEKEAPKHLIKLRKYFTRKKFKGGKVYLRFSEPIIVAPNMPVEEIERIGNDLVYSIARHKIVTSKAFASLILLSESNKTVRDDLILKKSSIYLNILQKSGAYIAPELSEFPKESIRKALAVLSSKKLINRKMTPYPYFYIEPDNRIELDFVKNTIMDHFFSLALAAKTKNADNYKLVSQLFKNVIGVPLKPFESSIEIVNEYNDELTSLIEPLFDSAKIVFHILLLSKKTLSQKRLLKDTMNLGKDLLTVGEITYPEALSKNTVQQIIQSIESMNFIRSSGRKLIIDKDSIQNIAEKLNIFDKKTS